MRWVRDLAAQLHNPQYDPPVAPPINRLSVANQKNGILSQCQSQRKADGDLGETLKKTLDNWDLCKKHADRRLSQCITYWWTVVGLLQSLKRMTLHYIPMFIKIMITVNFLWWWQFLRSGIRPDILEFPKKPVDSTSRIVSTLIQSSLDYYR